MKTIVLEKPEHFKLTSIEDPPAPGPGEALVQVHNVGICGTDISGYLGKMPFYSYPRIPGHELGVEVVAVGPDVTAVNPGDRCSVEPYMNCQNCFPCKNGHSNCCEELAVLGVHIDGGLRPRFLVPARKLHPSDSLTLEQLALVETLAIGCHAVNRACLTPTDDVLVIGAGPIGLSVIEFVKLSGARCLVMDLNEARLEFCRKTMQVADTIAYQGDESDSEKLRDLTQGRLPQVVIDATGNQQSMSNALNYVAFAGKLIYVGITTQQLQFLHALMHRRELTLLASRNALPGEFKQIIHWIKENKIDTQPWITHRIQMEELIDVFPSYTKPETGVIKAMVSVTE